ncbi:1673_t:CDS:2 [Funneliformis caledonium]|uniref:1673_t:CDS:1 n=1 Tax=Funneliformis caledonium TaxID=1117310 RepID=A0A9N9B7B0_9GLOM|nr:1673_t:CDS:2 [Funneliformis caledonium]
MDNVRYDQFLMIKEEHPNDNIQVRTENVGKGVKHTAITPCFGALQALELFPNDPIFFTILSLRRNFHIKRVEDINYAPSLLPLCLQTKILEIVITTREYKHYIIVLPIFQITFRFETNLTLSQITILTHYLKSQLEKYQIAIWNIIPNHIIILNSDIIDLSKVDDFGYPKLQFEIISRILNVSSYDLK